MADTTFHSITLLNTDPARIPDMAAEFNTGTSYAVRDYCTYKGILYRCKTAHAAGVWDGSHFQATNLDNEFDDKLKIPPFQASAPANPRVGDLWIDNDEDSPILSIDPAPIAGSTNAVQSGGVRTLIDAVDVQKASRYLLTGDYSTSATYEKGQLVFWYPETFSTSHSYVVGESCVHNGVVYKCTTTHTGVWKAADFEAQHNASTDTLYRCITDIKVPESWTAAHWQATNINTEINRLRESEADTDMIAENYGDSSSYAVGDYVVHNSDLFRCVSAVSDTGSWDPDDWQQVKLANDVSDLKSAINDKVKFNASWINRNTNPYTGITSPNTDTTKLSSTFIYPFSVISVQCTDDYEFAITRYVDDGDYYSANYAGFYTSNGWSTLNYGSQRFKTFNAFEEGYKYKFCVKRTNGENISISDMTSGFSAVMPMFANSHSVGYRTRFVSSNAALNSNDIKSALAMGFRTFVFDADYTYTITSTIDLSGYSDVKLIGNSTIFYSPGDRNIIYSSDNSRITIDGIIFDKPKGDYFHIQLDDNRHSVIKNCVFRTNIPGEGSFAGVKFGKIQNSGHSGFVNTIRNCTFLSGVIVMDTTDSFIKDNLIWGTTIPAPAIVISKSNQIISGNEIVGSESGSLVVEDRLKNVIITNNYFDGGNDSNQVSGTAITLGSTNCAHTVSNNLFFWQSANGIILNDNDNCNITNNIFDNCDRHENGIADIVINCNSSYIYNGIISGNRFYNSWNKERETEHEYHPIKIVEIDGTAHHMISGNIVDNDSAYTSGNALDVCVLPETVYIGKNAIMDSLLP